MTQAGGKRTRATTLSRRSAMAGAIGLIGGSALPRRTYARRAAGFSLACFSADVTVPIGHPLMGGGIAPASKLADPLTANGVVLLGSDKPIVLVAVDWCEIRNQAYDRWRESLAAAAGTTADRVLLASVHQHDAPVVDLRAQQILDDHHCQGRICDPAFHQRAVGVVAQSLSKAIRSPQPITQLGLGRAKVERIASNRRYHAPDGMLRFDRTSSTRDPIAHAAEEGTIDPWLCSISFYHGDRAVATLSAYAVHPMSHYGRGEVSSDFVGAARQRRRRDDPGVQQIYFSGASGNVTAGKYNDGSPGNRPALAERLYQAMRESAENAERFPLAHLSLSHTPLEFKPRAGAGFTPDDLEARLAPSSRPFDQCLAAMGLAWREHRAPIDLPVLDLGPAQFALLPGESYVEFQLRAEKAAKGRFTMVAGYGECATGYVPTEQAWQENDSNLRDWCWVAPGSEAILSAGIDSAIGKG